MTNASVIFAQAGTPTKEEAAVFLKEYVQRNAYSGNQEFKTIIFSHLGINSKTGQLDYATTSVLRGERNAEVESVLLGDLDPTTLKVDSYPTLGQQIVWKVQVFCASSSGLCVSVDGSAVKSFEVNPKTDSLSLVLVSKDTAERVSKALEHLVFLAISNVRNY
jgi:hypothetical protein